jgi:diguanylate cyclase
MDTTKGRPPAALAGHAAAPKPAALAKGALRRLAQAQLEPTPENYARAYAAEGGPAVPAATPEPVAAPRDEQPQGLQAGPPAEGKGQEKAELTAELTAELNVELKAGLKAELKAQGAAWAGLTERLSRNLDRGGRQWTVARRKESLKRLFDGSRSDALRLQQRMQSLLGAWETDQPLDPLETGIEDPAPPAGTAGEGAAWWPLTDSLHGTVQVALPRGQEAAALATALAAQADAVAGAGATPQRVAAIAELCEQARRVLSQRHRLVDELSGLCRDLTAGLTELAEDESWARGQCQSLQAVLAEADGLSVRGLRSASALLADTRQRQQRVRGERQAARDALKELIQNMLAEVGELGDHAGRFQLSTAEHAQAIERAETLESLADAVQAMLRDARAVQSAVGETQQRLRADRDRAAELESKVRALEDELRRLSDEVSTDALTQVANRRGLLQAFEAERGRVERLTPGGAGLAVALIDIDNFKKLNDSLGHAAGDIALKTLAGAVRDRLRPVDHLARFGGEEFVVLMPDTPLADARQALTRLQRSLSEALFLHEGREVFVTFSAGVTAWRQGEALETSLERADEALYEAKRSGKNRTCVG